MHTEFIVTNITFTIKKIHMYILTISYQEQEHLEHRKKKTEKSGIITIFFYYKGVHKK